MKAKPELKYTDIRNWSFYDIDENFSQLKAHLDKEHKIYLIKPSISFAHNHLVLPERCKTCEALADDNYDGKFLFLNKGNQLSKALCFYDAYGNPTLVKCSCDFYVERIEVEQ